MKSIAFIIPYFGDLPNYFPAWLNSCRQNPTIDFYLFTDQTYTGFVPENVYIQNISFVQIKELLQSQFEFSIGLSTPYKLCDYKPVYGAAFSEWVQDYDYWGHCDLDLIWGNIRHFMTDALLSEYDRILNQGHCSLYRNTESVNRYYRTLDPMGCMNWKIVYQSEKHFSFDEYAEHNGGGLSLIMEKNNVPIYAEWPFADISFKYKRFQLSLTEDAYYDSEQDANGSFFERDDEGLWLWFRKDGVLQKKEFMYAHYSRRSISGAKKVMNSDHFLLLPPGEIRVIKKSLEPEEAEKQMAVNCQKMLLCKKLQTQKGARFVSRAVQKMKRILKA